MRDQPIPAYTGEVLYKSVRRPLLGLRPLITVYPAGCIHVASMSPRQANPGEGPSAAPRTVSTADAHCAVMRCQYVRHASGQPSRWHAARVLSPGPRQLPCSAPHPLAYISIVSPASAFTSLANRIGTKIYSVKASRNCKLCCAAPQPLPARSIFHIQEQQRDFTIRAHIYWIIRCASNFILWLRLCVYLAPWRLLV